MKLHDNIIGSLVTVKGHHNPVPMEVIGVGHLQGQYGQYCIVAMEVKFLCPDCEQTHVMYLRPQDAEPWSGMHRVNTSI